MQLYSSFLKTGGLDNSAEFTNNGAADNALNYSPNSIFASRDANQDGNEPAQSRYNVQIENKLQ